MKIISFDCANRTIAYVFAEINDDFAADIHKYYLNYFTKLNENLNIIQNNLQNIKYDYITPVDITPADITPADITPADIIRTPVTIQAADDYTDDNILPILEQINSSLDNITTRVNNISDKINIVNNYNTAYTAEIDKIKDLRGASPIKIISSNVSDLLTDKVINTPKVVRAQKLKAYLTEIEKIYFESGSTQNSLVLIELQPSFNGACDTIGDQICYHFADKIPVAFISAKLKNKICMSGEHFADYMTKYKKKHTAEKKYADYNRHIAEKFFNITFAKTSKSLENHISDAFVQILAYFMKNKNL